MWLPNPEIDAIKHEKKVIESELEEIKVEQKEYDGMNMQRALAHE